VFFNIEQENDTMSRKTIDRRAMLAIGATLPALATSQALAVSSSWGAAPDAELIELGRRWDVLEVQCARAEELSEPNEQAWVAALDAIDQKATVDGVRQHVPDAVFLEAAKQADALHPLPSPTVTEVFDAMGPIERRILALPATSLAGLAVKARLAKFGCPNLWAKSADDADWNEVLVRNLIEAAIAAGGAA
jgi:hypothetical protein